MRFTPKTLATLVALNLALLVGLVVVTVAQPEEAMAQGFGGMNFTMINGDLRQRQNQAAIYVLETTQGKVVSLIYNGNNKQFEGIGRADIAADMGQGN